MLAGINYGDWLPRNLTHAPGRGGEYLVNGFPNIQEHPNYREGARFVYSGSAKNDESASILEKILRRHKLGLVITYPCGGIIDSPPQNDLTVPIKEATSADKIILYVPDMGCMRGDSGPCNKEPHYLHGSTRHGFAPFAEVHGKMLDAGGIFIERAGVADIPYQIDPFIFDNIAALDDPASFKELIIGEFCYPDYQDRMAEFLAHWRA